MEKAYTATSVADLIACIPDELVVHEFVQGNRTDRLLYPPYLLTIIFRAFPFSFSCLFLLFSLFR